MNKKRIAGRFLPSRVYDRWKWSVRCGLVLVPLILFLIGGIVVYLTPARYQSSVVFEYQGPRSYQEVAALLKSRNLIENMIRSLDLVKVWGVDSGTAYKIVSKATAVTAGESSGMIEVSVTDVRKELARDMAVEMVKSLETYEKSLFTAATQNQMENLVKSVFAAEDDAEEKQQALVRLMRLRSESAADPVSQLDVDAARNEWNHASSLVLDGRNRLAAVKMKLADPGKWTVVHTPAEVASTSVAQDDSLAMVLYRSLGIGLAFALAIPYLLELAFPRRMKIRGRSVGAAVEISGDPDVESVPLVV